MLCRAASRGFKRAGMRRGGFGRSRCRCCGREVQLTKLLPRRACGLAVCPRKMAAYSDRAAPFLPRRAFSRSAHMCQSFMPYESFSNLH